MAWAAPRVAMPLALALGISVTMTATATEPTTAQCIDAHEKALELKKNLKLRDARAALLQCATAACPAEVRAECADQLTRIRRLVPTVVFAAKDGRGGDLSHVHVTMDGQPLVDKLDGHAVEIDPGEHTFHFEASGTVAVDKKLIIAEGETDRRERVVLGLAAPPAPAGSAPAADASTSGSPSSAQRVAGIVVGAVGVVGIGLGAFFGVRASSKWSDAQNDCGTGCGPNDPAQAEKDDAQTAATASTVAFAAGGVAMVLGVVLFVTAPKRATAPKTGVRVMPAFDRSSGRVSLGGWFW